MLLIVTFDPVWMPTMVCVYVCVRTCVSVYAYTCMCPCMCMYTLYVSRLIMCAGMLFYHKHMGYWLK